MKFQRIIEAVYTQPWAITPAGWRRVHAVLQPYVTGKMPEMPRADRGTDIFGNALPAMEIKDGVAIIPVVGTLIQHAGMLEKMCGACSYQDIANDIDEAVSMAGKVKSILFNINSPGGECVGNQEVCDRVLEARENGMECRAFGDTMICSAAYNLAASCDQIFCTRSAVVGSIETIMAILDESEAFAQAGLKVELFTGGKFKGAGTQGTELTEEQRAYFMGLSKAFADMFKDNVRANREAVTEECMEGQVFVGEQAIDAGLVDYLVDDLDEVLEQIS